uniref:Type VI secretion system protein ImpG n=1 Tax=Candidatus Kentrum sp. DK TaxID=2126562 RepID=A0A450T7C7_9GAMM|nr:MAG: type VI secretion system protein ImpG [Candidatus Kentron sp. DK]
MDPRLLEYYNVELKFLREMGGEFAEAFPKIAGRLGLDAFECADPYVERLLEGCAFLASRVQLRIDAEFPRVTQHLLEMIYPNYLAPTPSMVIAQFSPDVAENALAEGYVIARGETLRGSLEKGVNTACEFRTAHAVTLWPIKVSEAEYIASPAGLPPLEMDDGSRVKGGIRIRLKCPGGHKFSGLELDALTFHLRGEGDVPARIYEHLFADAIGYAIGSVPERIQQEALTVVGRDNIQRAGFSEEEALLPSPPPSFSGYRLLHEYFAFPNRFLFFTLTGLSSQLRQQDLDEIDIIIPLTRIDPALDGRLDASLFALFCTPAVNLFPKRADRIHLNDKDHEYHVVPNRSRPMDFEIHSVTKVTGYGPDMRRGQTFHPFYSVTDISCHLPGYAYYALAREPRRYPTHSRKAGPQSASHTGGEVFISLVASDQAPYDHRLRQLALETLCTNRDLPLHMPIHREESDFSLESGAPVLATRCIAGPSRPRASFAFGQTPWRLISHLSLQYLSLLNADGGHRGTEMLREILSLYDHVGDRQTQKQIEGLRSVTSRAITRRLPGKGPVTYGRGIEITLTMDEEFFGGAGIFPLGAVLEEFVSRYVSINAFTETVLVSTERGEIMRWPTRIGRRQIA